MADPHHTSDAHAHAYVPGSQEIGEQKSTWSLFVGLAKWSALITAVAILFLTMWFRPGGNFIGAAIAGVVLAVAGWWFLRSPSKH